MRTDGERCTVLNLWCSGEMAELSVRVTTNARDQNDEQRNELKLINTRTNFVLVILINEIPMQFCK